ncbi:caspase, EACC1-associated type [Kutzneria sp. CA-103260]|uniref:caspase, EACC1-associated type n=1 Tax=Kutzneria sp. CA-103260 TaxID=2802641 RepID=UPI001BAD2A70|nr:TNT [Kutzneria sp. CA-103260]
MSGRRVALLIVTDTYLDVSFRALRAPQADGTALAEVLSDPQIGGFTVETLVNRPADEVKRRVHRLFREAGRDDTVLCYVSGHGIKDEPGRLHLATTDTERDAIAITALAATQLREMIDSSRARQTVLWLDCCYSGAFPAGRSAKSGDTVDVVDQLAAHSGRGCAVMTASTAIQYSFEGDADPRATGPTRSSVFTAAIVQGLRTGAADLNSDGIIDASELYQYVYDEVKRSTPEQTPTRNDQVVGDLHIARSNRGLPLDPSLPLDIRQSLSSASPRIRAAGIVDLAELADDGNKVARDTLTRLVGHGDQHLAQLARYVLNRTPSAAARTATPKPDEPRQNSQVMSTDDWPIQPLRGDPPLTLFRGKRVIELPQSIEVDRFGQPDGNLTYAAGTPFPQRSLVPEWVARPYHVYRLEQPVQALTGAAIPWFGQPGGGTAYLLPKSVKELLSDGTLVEVRPGTPPPTGQ